MLMTATQLDNVEEIRCPICRHGGATPQPASPTPSELNRIASSPPAGPAGIAPPCEMIDLAGEDENMQSEDEEGT